MKNTPPIILASTSPRRSQLLAQVGVSFVVQPISIDETPQVQSGKPEAAKTYVQRMAYEKSVAAQAAYGQDSIIITADTIGSMGSSGSMSSMGNASNMSGGNEMESGSQEVILVKPKDFADAKRMWQRMSGTSHQVMTAVCVAFQGRVQQALVSTDVTFVTLTDDMMTSYWQTGEPADKAGAYAIQGRGAAWVKAIKGSYANVVGLPVVETLAMIAAVQMN